MAIAADATAVTPDVLVDDHARLHGLDAMRGFAAVVAAVFHFSTNYDGAVADHWIAQLIHWGWLAVPVFFVISGYVIPMSIFSRDGSRGAAKAAGFLARRWIRVGFPLLAAAALAWASWSAAVLLASRGESPPVPSFSQVACHALATCALTGGEWLNPAFWTLGLEMQFYVLMAIAIAMRSRISRVSGYLILALAIALGFVLPNVWVFDWLPLFVMGGWIWHATEHGVRMPVRHGVLLLLAVLTFVSLGKAVALAGYAAALCTSLRFAVPRPLRQLGVVSFSLYLVHIPVGGRIVNYFKRACDPACGIGDMIGFGAIALAVSLIVAVAFWWAVERPAIALSHRVGRA